MNGQQKQVSTLPGSIGIRFQLFSRQTFHRCSGSVFFSISFFAPPATSRRTAQAASARKRQEKGSWTTLCALKKEFLCLLKDRAPKGQTLTSARRGEKQIRRVGISLEKFPATGERNEPFRFCHRNEIRRRTSRSRLCFRWSTRAWRP